MSRECISWAAETGTGSGVEEGGTFLLLVSLLRCSNTIPQTLWLLHRQETVATGERTKGSVCSQENNIHNFCSRQENRVSKWNQPCQETRKRRIPGWQPYGRWERSSIHRTITSVCDTATDTGHSGSLPWPAQAMGASPGTTPWKRERAGILPTGCSITSAKLFLSDFKIEVLHELL